MPELPEVETFRRSLAPHVVDRTLKAAWYSGAPLRIDLDGDVLRSLCQDKVIDLDRRGKYLLYRFSSGRVLISHLGMSGYYLIEPRGATLMPHTHVCLIFDGSDKEIRYIDPRRFGSLQVCNEGEIPEVLKLGPDPLRPEDPFTPESLFSRLNRSGKDIKAQLLDQSVVAGLGNIYVAEALFHAGIRPTRPGSRITKVEAQRLHGAIRKVLSEAVERRGTTLSDGGYVDAEGNAGGNQYHLRAYGLGGKPCTVCGSSIRHLVQGQRSSYFCPRCQK